MVVLVVWDLLGRSRGSEGARQPDNDHRSAFAVVGNVDFVGREALVQIDAGKV